MPVEWLQLPKGADSETRLAMGHTISLESADMVDLELIPGISDTLAEELISDKDRLAELAKKIPKEEALETVKGIGEAKAKTIGRYLSLRV